MATTPDRRVRRTRQALKDALLELMAEKGYEDITVQDLIDRADVGRSTFYTHYTDKEDLLRDGFANLRALVDQPVPAEPAEPAGPRRLLRFSLPLLRHVHEQKRLARVLFGRSGRSPVLPQFDKLLAGLVRAELPEPPASGPRVPPEAVVRYVVGAYLALVEWWLHSEPAMSPEDVDRLIRTLVAPGIRAASRP